MNNPSVYELMFRILLSSVLGVCIGLERKSHNHFAGVKTHMIVCFSSRLIMIVSQYGFADAEKFDAARLASQMISGVGFIGAGIILKRQNMMIQGLTTAAGILGTCGVGLAIGGGMYVIGIFSTVLYIVLFKVIDRIELFRRNNLLSYSIVFEGTEIGELINHICRDKRVLSYGIEQQEDYKYVITLMIEFATEKKELEWENQLLENYKITGFSKN